MDGMGGMEKNKRVPVVYVAGAYRGGTAWDVELNIRRAECCALEILRRGAVALCPHTMYRYFDKSVPDDFVLGGLLQLLERCDAMFVVEGYQDSAGTLKEIEHAEQLGIPVIGTLMVLNYWISKWSDGTDGTCGENII